MEELNKFSFNTDTHTYNEINRWLQLTGMSLKTFMNKAVKVYIKQLSNIDWVEWNKIHDDK